MSQRAEVIAYIRRKYHMEIEYPWIRYPKNGVYRHTDHQKIYCLIVGIARSELGLEGQGDVDALDVKLDDLLLRDLLIYQDGFLPGYHFTHGNWVTILLDGSVPTEQICHLIDISYRVTASAKTKKAIRPPKEWIIPSNPKYYDSVHAFDHTDEIDWKQGAGIKKGDIVYMYIGLPVSAILYKCVVTQTDIPWHFEREGLTIEKLMRIKLLKRYPKNRFTFEVLNREYKIFAVRGPRGVPQKLSEDLNTQRISEGS